jgi:hypothetical protein
MRERWNESEALGLIARETERLREEPYDSLVALEHRHWLQAGPTGTEYEMQVQALWDNPREKKNIRVWVSAGALRGWHAFKLTTRTFIVAPDGSFVGE